MGFDQGGQSRLPAAPRARPQAKLANERRRAGTPVATPKVMQHIKQLESFIAVARSKSIREAAETSQPRT